MSMPRCLWDVRGPSCASYTATLLLLPHSGGSAQSFSGWGRWFPTEVRVVAMQYPGRGSRLREPLAYDLQEVVAELVEAVSEIPGPLCVFGHSLGAFVGFEFCWQIESLGRTPVAFFASAAVPLHLHKPYARSPRELSDDELLDVLTEYGGTPQGLNAAPELMHMALGVCRSDIALAHEYRFGSARRRLRSPIVALGGETDPAVSADLLVEWQHLTGEYCKIHTFPGGHFYHFEDTAAVTAVMREHLRRLA